MTNTAMLWVGGTEFVNAKLAVVPESRMRSRLPMFIWRPTSLGSLLARAFHPTAEM